MAATENGANLMKIDAKVQRTLGLDFVTKQHANHCKNYDQFTD